jgi:tRNA dimethylallyltransferase
MSSTHSDGRFVKEQLPTILVLTGPTASGKSALALHLARQMPVEIISADSRQVYRYLNIGTAKPSPEEIKEVTHHLINILEPDQNFSAGEFLHRASSLIPEIISRGKLPLVVGGTGLYIRTLLHGLFAGPGRKPDLRRSLEEKLTLEGGDSLLQELRKADPVAAARMIPSNTRRIIRALEVFYLTGVPLSDHHRQQIYRRKFHPVVIGLEWDRKLLYQRINARVDAMLHAGLMEEVQSLRNKGFNSTLQSLQTVGYKEALLHLEEKLSFLEMTELIKQNTRRFAKRQMTWFRKEKTINWILVDSSVQYSDLAPDILSRYRNDLTR